MHRPSRALRLAASLLLPAIFAPHALAQTPVVPTPLTLDRLVTGLVRPLFAAQPPGDPSRILIVEQAGRIRLLKNGILQSTAFLDIATQVRSAGNEQGMLGLAFHPNYQTNGFFFVYYTDTSATHGRSVIERFWVDPADPDRADRGDLLDPPVSTRRITLRFDQPNSNHNGGWIAFGPDGFLYVASGDGGGSGDPGNYGQNRNSLLGKMLRIDINDDDFPADDFANYAIPPTNPFVGVPARREEIWAFGLRNPWRNSFDRKTGELWMADVGQNAWEEINLQPAASPGGENYGWKIKEGTGCYNTSSCTGPYVDPVFEYTQLASAPPDRPSLMRGRSITGGYVYRGTRIPDLRGTYLFADYVNAAQGTINAVNSFYRTGSGLIINFTDRSTTLGRFNSASIGGIPSFSEDLDGEILICTFGGALYRVIPAAPHIVADLHDGTARDNRCDARDLAQLLSEFQDVGMALTADIIPDQHVNHDDLEALLLQFGQSLP